MTFYEQELRKIVGERYPDATYVGRSCYVRLSDMNRAKIQFVTGIVANQYNALQLTILNRGEGQVDALRLRFKQRLPGPFADMVCSACSLQQRTIHITHDRADLHA